MWSVFGRGGRRGRGRCRRAVRLRASGTGPSARRVAAGSARRFGASGSSVWGVASSGLAGLCCTGLSRPPDVTRHRRLWAISEFRVWRSGGLRGSTHIGVGCGGLGPTEGNATMGYKHLDEADREEVWRLRAEGHNTNEISKRCGRSYATIATFLKTAGGLRPTSTSTSTLRLSAEEREEISRRLRARETFSVIAARLGRSTSTESRDVGRNGGRRRCRATVACAAAVERTSRCRHG
jgi:DNA-binding CsgD family transcriptional regulator